MTRQREIHKRPVALKRIGKAVRDARERRAWTRAELARRATGWLHDQFAVMLRREYGGYNERDLKFTAPSLTAIELGANEPTCRGFAALVNVLGLDANPLVGAPGVAEFSQEAHQLAALYDSRKSETAKRLIMESAVSIARSEEEFAGLAESRAPAAAP